MTKTLLSSSYLSDSSKEYAIYIAQTRAIPKLTDGLKDGARKALWLLRNKTDKIKVIALSGEIIAANLYNHGDASASETISGLAAPFLNNFCYLEGIGFFGSKLGPDAWGASRYIYVKKSKVLEDLLLPDIDIVPMMDNYDGSNKSAETFLPLFPTVLLNGVSGIAYGWSTEILPHKIVDLIDGCLSILEEKKVKKIKPHYNRYDLTIEHIEDNSWFLIGKAEITSHNECVIKELPPGIKIDKYKEFLDKLEESEKIQDYTDRSKSDFNITVQFKRGFLKNKTEQELIELLKLKVRVTERIVVLDTTGKRIVQYEKPEDLIKDFVTWRLDWFTKRYQTMLLNLETDLLYAEAVKLCFDNNFPSKLTTFNNKQESCDFVKKICSGLKLEDKQLDKIVSMPSYRWTKEHEKENINEIQTLKHSCLECENILKSPTRLKQIYIQELIDLRKKYA